ncbi:MAG: glycosyltransferase, partial [Gemmatirosa sp.]
FADADLGWVIADGDDGAFGVLDALAAGVPVLVDRGTDAARYVPDAIGGVHLEPGDVAGAAAVVAQLLAHDADRHSMGAAGRARVARIFTEAAMLDGFTRAAAAARERARPRAWGARHPADRG